MRALTKRPERVVWVVVRGIAFRVDGTLPVDVAVGVSWTGPGILDGG